MLFNAPARIGASGPSPDSAYARSYSASAVSCKSSREYIGPRPCNSLIWSSSRCSCSATKIASRIARIAKCILRKNEWILPVIARNAIFS